MTQTPAAGGQNTAENGSASASGARGSHGPDERAAKGGAAAEAAPAGPAPRLVLASSSPQRQAIVREARYAFTVHPANIDEDNYPLGQLPAEIARNLAIAKADAVAAQFPNDVVLGADTVVAFGDRMIGKARDAAEARQILELLSCTTHIVISGVAVQRRVTGFSRSGRVMSAVRMKRLTPEEIARYIESGQWQGKAGAYGIQDPDPFVTRISGSRRNIIGLPMTLTRQLLSEAGIEPGPAPGERR
jgi:septum formation protein